MTTTIDSPSFTLYRGSTSKLCPDCAGALVRASRLPLDRLVSLFNPVHRYRCPNFACQWQGCMPINGLAAARDPRIAKDEPPRAPVAALILLAALVTALVVVLWADLGKLLSNF